MTNSVSVPLHFFFISCKNTDKRRCPSLPTLTATKMMSFLQEGNKRTLQDSILQDTSDKQTLKKWIEQSDDELSHKAFKHVAFKRQATTVVHQDSTYVVQIATHNQERTEQTQTLYIQKDAFGCHKIVWKRSTLIF